MPNRRHLPVMPALGLIVCFVCATPARAEVAAASVSEAVSKGTATLSFRYRFEYVDQVGFTDKAKASTLRTRLGLETAAYKNFKVLLEFNNVSVIGSERYNSTRNGEVEFPVVADPDGTVVNRAYLRFSPKHSDFTLGRQRINLDDQRFIGTVGWRQNEQTFDSFTIGNSTLPDLSLRYGYIWQVKRVFGPKEGIPAAELDSDSHVVNAHLSRWTEAELSAYAYFFDFTDNPAFSNNTYGIRLTGRMQPSTDLAISYAAEFARQSDYGDNPTDYTANYHLLEFGAEYQSVKLNLGWAALGGDENEAGKQFITPLATLHKFQGWADKFLSTPDAGVDDRYIGLHLDFAGANASVIYHRFAAEAGGRKYGDEWDFSVGKAIFREHQLLLKYADYNADGFATDTTKWWLQYFISF